MRRPPTSPEEERGSIIILTALMLSVLVLFVSFAVDIGHETMLKRQLNAVADIAAQDATYVLGTSTSFADAVNRAKASATSNSFPLTGNNQLTVEIGTWGGTTIGFQSLSPTACTVTLPSGTVGACATASTATAVKVTASTHNDWYFLPGFQALSATAVAQIQGYTGLQVGTSLARVALTTGSVTMLNSLFGGSSVTLAGYQGLATAGVNVRRLATKLGFASPTALLSGSVTYKNLLLASGQVLDDEGYTSAGSTLIGLSSSSGTTGNTTIPMNTIFSNGSSDSTIGGSSLSAADGNLDAFDILTGGLDAAILNGTGAVELSNLNLGASGLGSAQVGLHVIEAPSTGDGPSCIPVGGTATAEPATSVMCAQAESAQVETQSTLTISDPSLTTALAAAGVSGSVTVTLPIYMSVAPAHAWVDGIYCGTWNNTTADVDAYGKTGVAHIAIGQDTSLASQLNQTSLTGTGSGGGSVSAGSVSVSAATLVGFAINVPAVGLVNVNIQDSADVDILASSATHLAQSTPPASGHSYTTPTQTFSPGRGPDTIAADSISPNNGVTATGDGVKDADSALAAKLPSASVGLGSALTAAGVSGTLNTTLSVALGPIAQSAITDVNAAITNLESNFLNPLASVLQIGLGSADVVNMPYAPDSSSTASPAPGTLCTVPTVVQ